jgi:DNA-binding MarR family transcriptional regulator
MSSPPAPAASDDPDPRARVAELTRELFRQAAALSAAVTEASGLHPTDVAALRALDAARSEPITVSRLGGALGLSSGAVTALVDRLERHGMVERTRDAGDRRRVHVTLTPRARTLGADLLEPIGERIGHAVAGLDPAGLEAVERYLAVVVDAPRAAPGGATATPAPAAGRRRPR